MRIAKFEEWFYSFYDPVVWAHIDIDKSYESWKAGRESMREEVTPIIFGQCESDNVAQRTVDEIMKL